VACRLLHSAESPWAIYSPVRQRRAGAIHIGARSVYGSVDEPPTGLTSRLLILATHPIPKCEQPSTTDIWPTTRHRLFSGFQVDTLVEFCRLLDRTIPNNTSPFFGPATSTSSITNGLPASPATAPRDLILPSTGFLFLFFLPKSYRN